MARSSRLKAVLNTSALVRWTGGTSRPWFSSKIKATHHVGRRQDPRRSAEDPGDHWVAQMSGECCQSRVTTPQSPGPGRAIRLPTQRVLPGATAAECSIWATGFADGQGSTNLKFAQVPDSPAALPLHGSYSV